ncbi:MAG: hypothetical protein JW794_05485 [Candidatus Cloacimonetes bacterium]|nr:hypothetical protein [Candidatus Cloacimonadota bacterium]
MDFFKNIFSSNKKQSKIEFGVKLVVNNEINPAREKLKKATILKNEKKYDEACKILKEAFSLKGSNDLMIKERLRLPMYLQLANKNDEGWRILNELNVKFVDVFSQAEIANQMRIFLQKEKKYTQAILFSIWSICKEVERDRCNIRGSVEFADQLASNKRKYKFHQDDNIEKVYGKTPKGNPITDYNYKIFVDRINDNISVDGVSYRILPLLKKLNKDKLLPSLSKSISEYLNSSKVYNLNKIGEVINEILLKEDNTF